jgi:hypothetical protein
MGIELVRNLKESSPLSLKETDKGRKTSVRKITLQRFQPNTVEYIYRDMKLHQRKILTQRSA